MSDSALRVAVVGAGPSGFYTIDALLKSGRDVRIDLFEKLPSPYGLVRAGVAPDHQKIKAVARKYARLASKPEVRYFGNVTLGRELTVEDLAAHYDARVYAIGCPGARSLGLEGEELPGVHSATEFVYWYNGHPEFAHLDFHLDQVRRVAVIGNGNVAVDVARILARQPEELAPTDLASPALSTLRRSAVTSVAMLGRRGPVQAAFSAKELAELAELESIDLRVVPEDLALDPHSQSVLDGSADRNTKKNVEILRDLAERPPRGARRLDLRFLTSPVAFRGDQRLEAMEVVRNRLVPRGDRLSAQATELRTLEPVDLVLLAIGYRGIPIPGLPFDDWTAAFRTRRGASCAPTPALEPATMWSAGRSAVLKA